MKTNFKIVVFLVLLFGVQSAFGQQPIGSVKAPLKSNYEGIPVHIGNPYHGFETCNPNDSVIWKGNTYYFEDVRIGKIKSANMIFETPSETLQSVTILLNDETSRYQAIRQAQKQFGPADISRNNMLNTYQWTTSPHGFPISISLTYKDHEAHSEMLIVKVK